jgi:hypothetical protein
VQQKGTLAKIKGIFRQPEAGERLESCKQELSRMVALFKVYQMNLFQCIFKSLAFIAGSGYRFNLVSNGENEEGCKKSNMNSLLPF